MINAVPKGKRHTKILKKLNIYNNFNIIAKYNWFVGKQLALILHDLTIVF